MGTPLEIGDDSKAGSAAGSAGGGFYRSFRVAGHDCFEAKVSVVTKVQAKDFFCALFNGRIEREDFLALLTHLFGS